MDGSEQREPFCAVYCISESSLELEIDQVLGNGIVDPDCSISSLYHTLPHEIDVSLRSLVHQRIRDGSVVLNYSSILEEKLQNHPTELSLYLHAVRAERQPASEPRITVAVVFVHEDTDLLKAFQGELDAFLSVISDDLCRSTLTLPDDLVTKIQGWNHRCVDYLCRIVRLFGDQMSPLLYALYLGQIPVLEPENPDLLADLLRMAQFCLDTWIEPEDSGAEKFYIKLNENDVQLSSKAKTSFTDDWSQVLQKLVSGGASATTIKELMHAFKHKANTDLSNFHKLLGAALNDHYALFKTAEFLRKTHNTDLLLKLVTQQDEVSEEQTTIIELLEEFLKV